MMMANYVVSQSTDLWDITNSTSGNGSAATINTGRSFYSFNGDQLSTLAPGSQIGQFQGTTVVIPANVSGLPGQEGRGVGGGPTGILAAGNFATMTAGSYVMKRVTTTLAGVANTFLRSGAGYMSGRRSIHKLETVRTHHVANAIRSGNWNVFTGRYTSVLTTSEDANTPSTNNSFAAFDQQAGRGATSGTLDSAANPTQAIPGELIIHHGSGLPLNDDYQPRTTW